MSCIWKYEVQHNLKNTFGYISLYFNVILVIPLAVNSRTQQGPIQSQCLCRSLDAATVTIKDAPRCSSYRNACVLINHISFHNSMTQRRLSTSVCVSESYLPPASSRGLCSLTYVVVHEHAPCRMLFFYLNQSLFTDPKGLFTRSLRSDLTMPHDCAMLLFIPRCLCTYDCYQ